MTFKDLLNAIQATGIEINPDPETKIRSCVLSIEYDTFPEALGVLITLPSENKSLAESLLSK